MQPFSSLSHSHDTHAQPSHAPVQPRTPILRKSNSEQKNPAYLKDYICPFSTTSHTLSSLKDHFSKNHHVSPDVLSSESQHLVKNIFHDSEPSSYEEATLNPAWKAAITQEFKSLYVNHIWNLVPLPAEKQVVG